MGIVDDLFGKKRSKPKTRAAMRSRWRTSIKRALSAARRALQQGERHDFTPRNDLRAAVKALADAERFTR